MVISGEAACCGLDKLRLCRRYDFIRAHSAAATALGYCRSHWEGRLHADGADAGLKQVLDDWFNAAGLISD
jgi:hypothetical protein